MLLTHEQLSALSEAFQEFARPATMEEFPARVVEIVKKFVPCDFYAYHEFAGSITKPIRHAVFPEHPTEVRYLAEFGHQHPFQRELFTDHDPGPFRLSDFISRRQWRKTDLYNLLFRPQNQNYQLTIAGQDPAVQVAVALNRSNSDFTEEERQMMDLICPHLVLAFHNNQLLADLTVAAQAQDRGYMIVDQSGRIRFSTLSARAYLEEYDDSVRNEILPERVKSWFLARAQWRPTVETKPVNELVLYQPTGRLIVQFVPSVSPGEFHLALQEKREASDPTLLQKLGLTSKQAEVLFWVSKGKRNGEIGQILGISLRTVEKHVEHILHKLSVETRTSAGTLANDYLTGRDI